MARFCTVTPNRAGERKALVAQCEKYMKRMRAPAWFLVDDEPKNDKPDLVWRVKKGIQQAKDYGFDWIVVLESDDFYPSDYLDSFRPYMDTHDFIGDPWSTYYSLLNRTWDRFHHHGRASLYTTAFRVSALDDFQWPPDEEVFLDMPLWRHAKRKRCKFIETGAIGIKGHGEGLTGGKGHRMRMKNEDIGMNFLRSKVDSDSFEFYKKIADRL